MYVHVCTFILLNSSTWPRGSWWYCPIQADRKQWTRRDLGIIFTKTSSEIRELMHLVTFESIYCRTYRCFPLVVFQFFKSSGISLSWPHGRVSSLTSSWAVWSFGTMGTVATVHPLLSNPHASTPEKKGMIYLIYLLAYWFCFNLDDYIALFFTCIHSVIHSGYF